MKYQVSVVGILLGLRLVRKATPMPKSGKRVISAPQPTEPPPCQTRPIAAIALAPETEAIVLRFAELRESRLGAVQDARRMQ